MLNRDETTLGTIYTTDDKESVVLGYMNSDTFVQSTSEQIKYMAKMSGGQGNIIYTAVRGRHGMYLTPGNHWSLATCSSSSFVGINEMPLLWVKGWASCCFELRGYSRSDASAA